MVVLTTAELLAQARQAYHLLMTGKSVSVLVDQNSERIEFTPANSFRLAAYIQQLEIQLARETGGRPINRPMRLFFP